MGFPWVFPGFSRGFPGFSRVFPGFSWGFLGVFPEFPQGFPRVFAAFSWGFQGVSPGFSRGFPGVFPGFYFAFPWFSRGFPRIDFTFFEKNSAASNFFFYLVEISRAISPKLYRSYYPHWLGDSLSPVFRIFLICLKHDYFNIFSSFKLFSVLFCSFSSEKWQFWCFAILFQGFRSMYRGM